MLLGIEYLEAGGFFVYFQVLLIKKLCKLPSRLIAPGNRKKKKKKVLLPDSVG